MIESIVDKIEPLKNDHPMKGKHIFTAEMFESETKPCSN